MSLHSVDVWQRETSGNFSSETFGEQKLWRIPACLLSLYMTRDIVKILMVKFGKPSVIPKFTKVYLCQIFAQYGISKTKGIHLAKLKFSRFATRKCYN